MQIEKTRFANALALTTLILWVLCSLIALSLPGFYMRTGGMWMHMNYSNLANLGMWPMMTVNTVVFGGLTMVIAAWVTGYIFGWVYEWLGNRK